MSRFDDFDSMVLDRIRQRPLSFTELQSRDVMAAADKLGTEGFRVLDRRLQALRKTGRIQFHKSQWHFVQQPAAAS